MEQERKTYNMGMNDLWPFALGLGILGIGIPIILSIQADVSSDFVEDSIEYNASQNAIGGTSNVAARLPTIGLVGGAAVLIGLLVYAFVQRN